MRGRPVSRSFLDGWVKRPESSVPSGIEQPSHSGNFSFLADLFQHRQHQSKHWPPKRNRNRPSSALRFIGFFEVSVNHRDQFAEVAPPFAVPRTVQKAFSPTPHVL